MKRDIDALIESNQGIVGNIARKHFSSRLPDDDLMQCGMIGLWEAAEKWSGLDPFPAFARVCIYHNLMDYVRGLSAKKRLPCDPIEDADIAQEDKHDDLETLDLLTEFSRVFPIESTEYAVLSNVALFGDILTVARLLSLDAREVRKIAKRTYGAIIEAREAKEQRNKE